MLRRVFRRVGRSLSPTALILAGLCFGLPFVSVACDTPGGFGRAGPGGSTTYTGVDLVTGGEPDVTPPDKLLPQARWRDDRIAPQPVATIALLLIVAGAVVTIAASDPRIRRASATAFAGGATVLLVTNQALVESAVEAMVAGQITQPLPAGKAVRDFVNTGNGFGLCFMLLVVTGAANAIGWFRLRSRRPGAPLEPTRIDSLPDSPAPNAG